MPEPPAAGATAAGGVGLAGATGGVGAAGLALLPIDAGGAGLLRPKSLAWASEGMSMAAVVRVKTVAVVRREGLNMKQVSNGLKQGGQHHRPSAAVRTLLCGSASPGFKFRE